jgi:AcrR family transcriptional regulator
LSAALELFAERGFHGTAVPTVAEKAGVGAGTIYRYFASKEALVNALYQKWKNEIARRIYTDFPALAPAREQLSVVWRRMAEFALKQREAYAFLELHHHPYLDAQSRAIEERLLGFATTYIRRWQQARVLRDGDPMLLLSMVNGAFTGVARACREGRLPESMDTFLAAEPCSWELVRA